MNFVGFLVWAAGAFEVEGVRLDFDLLVSHVLHAYRQEHQVGSLSPLDFGWSANMSHEFSLCSINQVLTY